MYLVYLLPSLVFGYGFINANLVIDFFDWHKTREKDAELVKSELVRASEGEIARMQNQLDESHAAVSESIPVVEDGTTSKLTEYLLSITVLDDAGTTQLPVPLIQYAEVKEKRYIAHTAGGVFQIRKTIAELEAELDPQLFYRLNRGTIVNLRAVKNYSYWEYDKYVVRLNDGNTEFTMQRSRLKELKARLAVLG